MKKRICYGRIKTLQKNEGALSEIIVEISAEFILLPHYFFLAGSMDETAIAHSYEMVIMRGREVLEGKNEFPKLIERNSGGTQSSTIRTMASSKMPSAIPCREVALSH